MSEERSELSDCKSEWPTSKRRGSFRRLASSMREKVQTLVSNVRESGSESGRLEDMEVPSAVNPSRSIRNASSIDVSAVLQHTNCYSSPRAHPSHYYHKRHSEAELTRATPRIVVTVDSRSNLRDNEDEHVDKEVKEVRRPGFARQDNTELRRSASLRHTSRSLRSSALNTASSTLNLNNEKEKEEDLNDDQLRVHVAMLKIKEAILCGQSQESLVDAKDVVARRSSFSGECREWPGGKSDSKSSNNVKTSEKSRTSASRRRSACGEGSKSKCVARSSSLRRVGSGKRVSGSTVPMIWEYFAEIPNHPQHGRCKTCQMSVSCKFNTGNFVRHLQLTHKDVYRQYHDRMENAWTRSMLQRNLK